MPKALILLALGLSLASCQHTPVLDIPPVADVCPPEGAAPLKPQPLAPELTEAERQRVYTTIAATIDPFRAQALVRYWEAELPVWGKLGWERLAKIKPYCDAKVQ